MDGKKENWEKKRKTYASQPLNLTLFLFIHEMTVSQRQPEHIATLIAAARRGRKRWKKGARRENKEKKEKERRKQRKRKLSSQSASLATRFCCAATW